ncbi:MAG: alpha/beta fold hydrolase [Pyrinomonadaceae bacterium]
MKKIVSGVFLTLVLLFPYSLFAQQKKGAIAINYGDNPKAGKYVAVNGIKMYYEIYGAGEPLLLIHNNGGSIASFKYQIPYFAKRYKVIAVDSRAQGKSVDAGEKIDYRMMTEDFSALLDTLKIKSAYVIGWSDGGINGLLLAINHPEKVKKLAVTGANLTPDPSVLNPATFAMISEYAANLKAAKQDAATKNNLKLFQLMLDEPNIPLMDLQKIKCPVLVMGGDNDAIKPSHTLQIFENIPNAYLWIFPAAGHGTLQRYSTEFNTKVNEFFTQPYRKAKWDDFDQ